MLELLKIKEGREQCLTGVGEIRLSSVEEDLTYVMWDHLNKTIKGENNPKPSEGCSRKTE